VTVFPDHVSARVAAVAVAAALLARQDDGRGRHIELAQSDVVLHQLAALAAFESLVPGAVGPAGNRGRELFGGVFACAGDDQWAVVDACTDAEVAALRQVVGAPDSADRADAVARWAAGRSPAQLTEALQAAGVPAAGMVRLTDLLDDPQLAHRSTYTTLVHPGLEHELPAESVGAPFAHLPPTAARPAPLPGEQSREVCRDVLGLSDEVHEGLLSRGVVHEG
jgi:crotonobetainyl-CoA:carnitine CoA-transferase CaiB-like acyl-CoA transferase